MDTQGKLTAWLFLEAVLVARAPAAALVFAYRKWLSRAFRGLPEDMYLIAVVYPFTGAVVGGLVSIGVLRMTQQDVVAGAGFVFAGLAVAAYMGGTIAMDRAREEAKPLDPFSVEEWRRDLHYLQGLRRISGEERREWEERASRLAAHGRQEREGAERYGFGTYWLGLRRRAQVWACVWAGLGICVAAFAVVQMDSPWYWASSLTGGSLLVSHLFSWSDERGSKKESGRAQEEAAERIRQRLEVTPATPVPSLRQRLAMVIFPGRGHRD